MRVPVVLHAISGLDQDVLESAAVPITKGLSRCVQTPGPLRNELTVSPDFWSVLQRLHRHEAAAPMVFELLQSLVESTPPVITADNYESAVSLANDFMSAGSVGSVGLRQRASQHRRPKGPKPAPARYDFTESAVLCHP